MEVELLLSSCIASSIDSKVHEFLNNAFDISHVSFQIDVWIVHHQIDLYSTAVLINQLDPKKNTLYYGIKDTRTPNRTQNKTSAD